ncbi:O-antigen ligase family protein [Pedobacter aquatilis]|uniref:O-antigen ligase family protein n=1 Tax=Pedobacter aquatilis TaxID=351343 RepID=UPI00292EF41E|nr:O-antigen ligase family protein [Pedobacter aquatilis]
MRSTLLFTLIFYCFTFIVLGREIGSFPFGIFIEVFIFLLTVGVIVKTPREDWSNINNSFVFLMLFWFGISVLEVVNPGSNSLAWVAEIRTTAFYPLFLVILGFLIFKTNKSLDIFLILVIGVSTLGSLNGMKQLFIGLSPGETAFVTANASTHLLWGRLRVFSFYTGAGQFGASQAHIGLMALILALGPIKTKWKKILLFICAGLNLYGMLISGTRGALFALVAGVFLAIFLSKNYKVVILGGFVAVFALGILKFTHIGDGNYQIYRLRTALNPEDPSLNVRFITQRNLKEYMASRPFGGGLGVIGYNGVNYNSDKYLSTVQPDSYFVKLWAMYGVVGLTIWLSIMMFILGKCCAIVWRLEDPQLKAKIIALTAGYAGVLICSYGNEIINNMPTSIVIYISWVFIFISPRLEKLEKSTLLD